MMLPDLARGHRSMRAELSPLPTSIRCAVVDKLLNCYRRLRYQGEGGRKPADLSGWLEMFSQAIWKDLLQVCCVSAVVKMDFIYGIE
ncbi:Hypothetical predicted protein [Olea europaea subsp. europaea]|uniref:Uncharacterized protein n=1 Tax=Olea europaea subsp. europaea TaxID=158383 RepID=A0A8S0R655_OLEEU|nr:Hypothetical predicted protein [Olea europaea subsp. europaea]